MTTSLTSPIVNMSLEELLRVIALMNELQVVCLRNRKVFTAETIEDFLEHLNKILSFKCRHEHISKRSYLKIAERLGIDVAPTSETVSRYNEILKCNK